MPDSTPIYGFQYPCPGETVGASSFSLLANAIDAKLNELAADEAAALNRPNGRRESVTNTATNNVLNVTAGVGSSFTIPAAGVWLVSAWARNVAGGVGVPNEYRLRVRQNATARFGATRNLFSSLTFANVSCMGPLVCAVGDTIDTDFFYTGTLTSSYIAIMNLKMIVRIA